VLLLLKYAFLRALLITASPTRMLSCRPCDGVYSSSLLDEDVPDEDEDLDGGVMFEI
jgi:hypothetical protein